MSFHRAVNFWLFLLWWQDVTPVAGSFQRWDSGPKRQCWMAQAGRLQWHQSPEQVFGSMHHRLGSLYGGRLVVPEGKKRSQWNTSQKTGNSGVEMLSCTTSDYCISSAVHFLVLSSSLFCVLLFSVKQVWLFPLGNNNKATMQHLLSNHFFLIFTWFHLSCLRNAS